MIKVTGFSSEYDFEIYPIFINWWPIKPRLAGIFKYNTGSNQTELHILE
jgi:hypothetical protein